jgi:hypothetical protein
MPDDVGLCLLVGSLPNVPSILLQLPNQRVTQGNMYESLSVLELVEFVLLEFQGYGAG